MRGMCVALRPCRTIWSSLCYRSTASFTQSLHCPLLDRRSAGAPVQLGGTHHGVSHGLSNGPMRFHMPATTTTGLWVAAARLWRVLAVPTPTPPPLALDDATTTFIPPSLFDTAMWYLKRTFQPSIVRKKRKMGFLVRQRTVGGRRTLERRRAKGRARLGGGI